MIQTDQTSIIKINKFQINNFHKSEINKMREKRKKRNKINLKLQIIKPIIRLTIKI